MTKGDYTYSDLVRVLQEMGLKKGDVVHVHSALFPLGTMADVPLRDTPKFVLKAFREVLGKEGTLTVPTSFDDYARFGTPFDCRKSPVDRGQGVFSQYITSLPESVRSFNPLSSVTGVGPLAKSICHEPSGSGYGAGSPWEKLYDYDSKMCFLGLRPSQAFTFVIYIQARFGVPHFYNKIYTTPVYEDGVPVPYPIVSCVRYRDPRFKISENPKPFETHLEDKGYIQKGSIGRGWIYYLSSTKKIYEEGAKKVQENNYYFCVQKPEFVPGEIPMDGSTGKYIPEHIRLGKGS
ncbi:hypothetical protein BVX98_04255 [bacterium F11]|nr:hypothetical protein BVX98_04255 [bacterium F11]